MAGDLTLRITVTEIETLQDRKSTRLNSSHLVISYAVFCLKKKKHNTTTPPIPHSTPKTPPPRRLPAFDRLVIRDIPDLLRIVRASATPDFYLQCTCSRVAS